MAKTAACTRAYADANGFLTLLSDGRVLTGAHALGPETGEWLQQATLAVRARVPLDVLRDTIQPFPTFSEIYVAAFRICTIGSGPRTARRHSLPEGELATLVGFMGSGDDVSIRLTAIQVVQEMCARRD